MLPSVLENSSNHCMLSDASELTVADFERFVSKEPSFLLTTTFFSGLAAKRFDHVSKHLAFAALCIHWFNPLVWAAFILSGKDMEMSCDEAVIKKLGEGIRADYSASLLTLAMGHHIIAGSPLAFGEGDTKGRIKNMANWKQPRKWVGENKPATKAESMWSTR